MKFTLDSTKLQKTLLYGALIFLFSLVQITLLPRYRILGVTPDVTLSCVLAVAMFDGRKSGAIAGIAAGFYIDAIGSVGLSLSPVVYMLCGYLTGIGAELLFRRGLVSFTMTAVGGYAVRGIATLLCLSASTSHYSLWQVLGGVVLPEIAVSVLFSYPVFFAFRLAAKHFHKKYELVN